jgi:GMP synthase (glutamine-hydrolysing)
MLTALALRHVAYEDLDGFGPALLDAGYAIEYRDALFDNQPFDPLAPDLMIVLGSPSAVYERDVFPFIDEELEAVRTRITHERPVLGICFGAQLIANALGEKIHAGRTFEFGWSDLQLTEAGKNSPVRHFAKNDRKVFHCHGDTFALPEGAERLASTPLYENQAFRYGPHLALQFHGEVTERGLRRWYIGNVARIRATMGVASLRSDTEKIAPSLNGLHTAMLRDWLADIGT